MPPRHYTVEPGKALNGTWPLHPAGYHLQVRGPNGWYRELRGHGRHQHTVRTALKGTMLQVQVESASFEGMTCSNRMTGQPMHLEPGPQKHTAAAATSLASSHLWYDVEVAAPAMDGFYRRFGGRMDNGRDLTSRPPG